MSVVVNILEQGKGVEILITGNVMGHELIEAQQKVYDKNFIRDQKYQIIDKSNCVEYNVTAEEIELIADLDRQASKINPKIIIAVIESNSSQYGLTELWQMHVDEFILDSKSFLSRDLAMIWIKEKI